MTERLIKNILSEELFNTRICESVEQQQILDFIYEELLCEKLLFGEPVSVPELRKILHNKIVNFEFIKLDGEVRPAKGTTMMKYIPKKDHPTGLHPSSEKVATFFDLDKTAWRSVSNKSKEIVLQRDPKTEKPIVVVTDKVPKEEPKISKPDKFDVKTFDTPIEPPVITPKPPVIPPVEPIVRPSITPDIKPGPSTIPEPEEFEEPEEPLDITDATKPADEIKDDEIIVSKPEELKGIESEMLPPKPEVKNPPEINQPPSEDLPSDEDEEDEEL